MVLLLIALEGLLEFLQESANEATGCKQQKF